MPAGKFAHFGQHPKGRSSTKQTLLTVLTVLQLSSRNKKVNHNISKTATLTSLTPVSANLEFSICGRTEASVCNLFVIVL